jgi:hypothetical protein
MEDRPGDDRGLSATVRTLTRAAGQAPTNDTSAGWTDPAVRPSQPVQVVEAGIVMGEPRTQRAWAPVVADRRLRAGRRIDPSPLTARPDPVLCHGIGPL